MDNVKLDQTADVDKSSTFNLEAEQALIGLLLVNSDVLGEIESIIDEDHFYDGINKKRDPGKPLLINMYTDYKDYPNLKKLPYDLETALEKLNESKELNEAFGEKVIKSYF